MIQVQVKVHNLEALRRNFQTAPAQVLKQLARATSAAIFEVEKQAVDRNFQFKTPRPQRTGQLQQSFSFGRYISPNGLLASIGPTVRYAPYVYYGTSRGLRPNRYMDRIARAAESGVQDHFDTAVARIINHLSDV